VPRFEQHLVVGHQVGRPSLTAARRAFSLTCPVTERDAVVCRRRVQFAWVAEHTGGVASKYDSYWAGRLGEIRAAVERAAAGFPAVVELPGLESAGERQSWSGSAEVRCRSVMRSSMVHATSLGKVVAGSGICAAWPESTFRLCIAAAGDVLTVSAAKGGAVPPPGPGAWPPGPAPAPGADGASGPPHAGSAAGGDLPGDRLGQVLDATAADGFYRALGQLAEMLAGPRVLRECRGADGWPRQGVYFFFEVGEVRADGSGRVVRVGTHALTATSQATLWGRLRQHRGHVGGRHPGGGNHRASVFRRHVGAAIIRREQLPGGLLDSWLDRHGPRPGWAVQEAHVERAVSDHIGAMPFLWLSVPDRADRGYVERNSIALTSRLAEGTDQSSPRWLGRDAVRTEISQSGLWNVDHIRHHREPGFLDLLGQLVQQH